jgi:hypothetical protein
VTAGSIDDCDDLPGRNANVTLWRDIESEVLAIGVSRLMLATMAEQISPQFRRMPDWGM